MEGQHLKSLSKYVDWASLLLTLYGLVITIAIAAKDANGWLLLLLPLPLIFAAPSLVMVVQWIWPPKNADDQVKRLLAVAVRPRRFPVCCEPEATIACAKPIAGLAARHLDVVIGHLMSLISSFDFELDCEEFFTPRELASHAITARRIHATLMAHLTGDLAIRCLRLVPDAVPIYDALHEVYEQMAAKVLTPIENALALPDTDLDRPKKIQRLLKEVLRSELRELRRADCLPRLHASAKVLTQEMEIQWDDAVLGLRGVRTCRPARKEAAPSMPQDITDFLKHFTQPA
jgi:hypothetical protein